MEGIPSAAAIRAPRALLLLLLVATCGAVSSPVAAVGSNGNGAAVSGELKGLMRNARLLAQRHTANRVVRVVDRAGQQHFLTSADAEMKHHQHGHSVSGASAVAGIGGSPRAAAETGGSNGTLAAKKVSQENSASPPSKEAAAQRLIASPLLPSGAGLTQDRVVKATAQKTLGQRNILGTIHEVPMEVPTDMQHAESKYNTSSLNVPSAPSPSPQNMAKAVMKSATSSGSSQVDCSHGGAG